jgi:hypothetical protein
MAKKTYLKHFLGSWILAPRKTGAHPQSTYNNNFATAAQAILAPLNHKLLFKEWTPLAKNETIWNQLIFNYFETCQSTNDHPPPSLNPKP